MQSRPSLTGQSVSSTRLCCTFLSIFTCFTFSSALGTNRERKSVSSWGLSTIRVFIDWGGSMSRVFIDWGGSMSRVFIDWGGSMSRE